MGCLKWQNNTGNESFNNVISGCPTVQAPFAVDFEAHVRSMEAVAEMVATVSELEASRVRQRRGV